MSRPTKDSSSRESCPRIGIIGGGQLAKMLALAGYQLGCNISVLARTEDEPATQLAERVTIDNGSKTNLLDFSAATQVITLENEFVSQTTLTYLQENGHTVFPTPESIANIQDKYIQKQTLVAAGLAVAPFCKVENPEQLAEVTAQLGLPIVLKARLNSYDGKGNITVSKESELTTAWQHLQGHKRTLYAEVFIPYQKELAIIVTAGRNGEVATYPLVESKQINHICHTIRAPAEVDNEVKHQAVQLAQQAVKTVGGIGSFGVEMFLTKDQKIIINELAPRVHNSGHYSIEACYCSQFENHIRAIMGWPLGSTELRQPSAVMVNLLGNGGESYLSGLDKGLAIPNVHFHHYAKYPAAKGRKMGHITVTGQSLEETERLANKAAGLLIFGK